MKVTIIREPNLSQDENEMVDEFESLLGLFLSEFDQDKENTEDDEVFWELPE